MRTLRPLSLMLLPAVICLALGACGQKGPLYLPDATPTTRPQQPAPAPATTPDPATDKKKDDGGTGVR